VNKRFGGKPYLNFANWNPKLAIKRKDKAYRSIWKRKNFPYLKGKSFRLSHDRENNAGRSLSKWPWRPQNEGWAPF